MQDEDERLAEVEHFQPRDTASTPALDRLAQLAASLFRAPMAAVSLVDGDRQWLKARCGLDLTSTAREHALCSHVLPLGPSGILVVPDAAQDARFAANPLVTGAPCIRFYAGAALTSRQGHVLGALCVIDSRPHPEPDKDSLNQLRVLADAVVDLLELERIARAQDEQVNLLKMAEGVSGMGHWRLDLRSKRVVWSKEVYAIHGLSPDSFDPNLDRAVDFYHPDDQPKVHAALDEAISSAGPVGFQLRLRCADGDVRDVVGRSLCERDRSDTPVAVFGVFQDITEHTRALAAARRNEERYRLLAENMADVVTRIRPDGSSNYISPAIERLLGYRPEEMAGRSAQDFVHPEDQAAVVSVFATLCRSEAQRTIEVRAVRKDGALRWVEVSFRSMPMEKGGFEIVAVIRDITARRELESAAAERERFYRLLADNSIDLINRSSLDCEILYVSPSARELTGYEPDELIGRKTTDLIHPEDWPYVRRAYTKLVHFGHAARVEPITYRMMRKDGAHVWVEVAPKLVWDGDKPIEFVDVVRNISARKAVEEELVEAHTAAEAAAEAKAQFLATMSHELRTPLTSILGFTKLLAEQPNHSELSARCLKHLDVASLALLSTVNDILDFSKLEAGQVAISPVATDVRQFFRMTLDLLSPQATTKNLALLLDIHTDVPVLLAIDPDRVRQIVLNLAGNAIKFTAAGNVALSVAYDATTGQLSFAVTDTGTGIPSDRLGLLFQRFSQVDGGNARTNGGTGLGLAICKELTELMGGRIGVDSKLGAGSRFWCTINAEAVAASGNNELDERPGRLSGIRVLVADDHPQHRELAMTILKLAGCEITEARDGFEALTLSMRTPFDVMLIDMMMPGLTGIETLKSIRRSRGPNDTTPALAYTAADAGEAATLVAAGFAGVVFKPVQPSRLIHAISNATEILAHAC